MIHDAQQHAYQWHDMSMREHQNVADMSSEGIRRMYHTAVLNYWKQLERFSSSSHVADIWHETIDGVGRSLARLGELRFKTETVEGGDLDPDSGQLTQARERPLSLSIEESTYCLDQLDKVANALQFDAQAKEERPRYGSVEVGPDDDHHGVEVPTDAD